MRHLADGTVLAATAALAAPGREGARQYRPGHAPRLNPPLKEATMVSAPRLHTSAAHSPAGDGNQATKTWPAVSLYLLVAWLAAGGLILLQPITHIPTVVLEIVQFAPTTAVLVLMATRRVAAPRIWQGPVSATLRRIAVVFVIMAAVFGLTVAGLAAAGRPVQLTSLRSLGEPFWLIVVAQLVGACGEEFGWRSFLQPHLERRYSPLASALIVGFAWGTWHLGVTSNGLLVYAVFVATAMCLSVIMAEMIRGVSSLAVAGVFHWLLNIGILMLLNNFTNINLTEMTVFAVCVAATAVVVRCFAKRSPRPGA
jgi:uncharacterized protein